MKKKIYVLMLILGITVIESCTKLDEQILDETTSSNLSEKQAADGIIAPVYARLPDLYTHTVLFAIQEISTDEAILPYRGGTDWGDNGIYIALHQHTSQSTDPNLRNAWLLIQQGMSRAITAMNTLPANNDPSAKTYLAEARGMRAYFNMLNLDLFGIVFVKEDVGETSKIIRGEEAFQYVKNEFLAVEPNLENTTTNPGRLTKSAVWGLLARLHMNAAVYRDVYADKATFKTEDMDKAIEYCDKVINSGQFQLAKDYFSIFGSDNHSNKELIFAVDQRAELNGHNRLAYFSLSGDQFPLTEFPAANGTDGPAITPDFYQTWAKEYAPKDPAGLDPRFYKQNMGIYTNPSDSCVAAKDHNINRGILRGQQYGLLRKNGVFLRCRNGNFKLGKLFNESRNRPTLPVDFTEQVDFTTAGSNYSTGYRVEKYEFSKKSASGRNLGEADIVILRLADIYLMRAEAKLRKSNDVSSALADVNTVRVSRTNPAPALKEMSLDILFKERGFEFYWEHQRRTDMIRFGKYEDSWTEKNNKDKFKRLFPIPQTAIDGASNLPGYLKQNPSY
jgi:starch-binding outer membrane protein, SusD/RagB family